ncbi:putative metallopeptidase [Blastopirellula marina]|nr:putative metallopeptidase [Blastopirellula marina]
MKRPSRPKRNTASRASRSAVTKQPKVPSSTMGRVRLHGSAGRRGFDFTHTMRLLVNDMVMRMPELAHIDMSRVAVAMVQARVDSSHGIFASLTPMRFEKGSRFTTRRGRKYSCQTLLDEHGREMLYILSFYLPRFQNMDFSEKMITIFHELWHISPDFDGDIRRHPGRCYAHSSSQKEYDEQMAVLSAKYLMKKPPPSLYQFLEFDFGKLFAASGGVYGVRIPRPKLIPVAS